MTLTLDEVRKTKFHMARRTGYEVSEVDLFVDRVEASFAQLTEENQMLKQQVETLKQAQQNARPQDDRREPSNEDLARSSQQGQSQQATGQRAAGPQQFTQQGAGGEKVVVTTSADASPAVVRLVQLATEQAEQLVSEANADAKRKVDEATHKAHQITTDARTKADRVESEARVNAEKLASDAKANADRLNSETKSRAEALDREATTRRTQLFSDLESERDKLRDAVGQLRQFEANYRQNLTAHLKQQMQSVESGRFEPDNKPGLLKGGDKNDRDNEPNGRRSFGTPAAESKQGQDSGSKDQGGQQGANREQSSTTPRLDALLGDNQGR